MWAMIRKELRQVQRDRRTMAMMILLPVVLLVVFGYAASFDVDEIRLTPVGDQVANAVSQLPDLFVVAHGRDDAPVDILRRNEADVVVTIEGSTPRALVDGSNIFAAKASIQAFSQAETSGAVPGLDIEVLFNPDLSTSAVLVPGLGGLILLFIGALVTSLGVVRERQSGTLEQLAVMPLRASDVFIGKVAPYFLVAAADLVIALAIGVFVFDVPFNGNPAWLAIGSVLFLFVTLGIGVLISTVSQNQGQAIQLALMTVMPQVLLSGLIFPLSSMGTAVRWIGYVLPLTWFNIIARDVMLKNAPLQTLAFPMGVLALMSIVVSGLAIWRFNVVLAPARHGRGHAGSPKGGRDNFTAPA